jgi:hypothetical protein
MLYARMRKKFIFTTLLGLGVFAGSFFLLWRVGENFVRVVPETRKTVIWSALAVSTALTTAALRELYRLGK